MVHNQTDISNNQNFHCTIYMNNLLQKCLNGTLCDTKSDHKFCIWKELQLRVIILKEYTLIFFYIREIIEKDNNIDNN